ncbi:hypothetical protein BT63DRAFT_439884 [Microthyrium microscopicum]|uniref:Uncharacterized protein n=1 Tax=Microthyrium microscopicum TaxID=703497 RepID=A0A6A6UE44_9PEZI|nr:hypothetical protein BT63DRAFT_439884 [Microthyrium microscopicum]
MSPSIRRPLEDITNSPEQPARAIKTLRGHKNSRIPLPSGVSRARSLRLPLLEQPAILENIEENITEAGIALNVPANHENRNGAALEPKGEVAHHIAKNSKKDVWLTADDDLSEVTLVSSLKGSRPKNGKSIVWQDEIGGPLCQVREFKALTLEPVSEPEENRAQLLEQPRRREVHRSPSMKPARLRKFDEKWPVAARRAAEAEESNDGFHQVDRLISPFTDLVASRLRDHYDDHSINTSKSSHGESKLPLRDSHDPEFHGFEDADDWEDAESHLLVESARGKVETSSPDITDEEFDTADQSADEDSEASSFVELNDQDDNSEQLFLSMPESSCKLRRHQSTWDVRSSDHGCDVVVPTVDATLDDLMAKLEERAPIDPEFAAIYWSKECAKSLRKAAELEIGNEELAEMNSVLGQQNGSLEGENMQLKGDKLQLKEELSDWKDIAEERLQGLQSKGCLSTPEVSDSEDAKLKSRATRLESDLDEAKDIVDICTDRLGELNEELAVTNDLLISQHDIVQSLSKAKFGVEHLEELRSLRSNAELQQGVLKELSPKRDGCAAKANDLLQLSYSIISKQFLTLELATVRWDSACKKFAQYKANCEQARDFQVSLHQAEIEGKNATIDSVSQNLRNANPELCDLRQKVNAAAELLGSNDGTMKGLAEELRTANVEICDLKQKVDAAARLLGSDSDDSKFTLEDIAAVIDSINEEQDIQQREEQVATTSLATIKQKELEKGSNSLTETLQQPTESKGAINESMKDYFAACLDKAELCAVMDAHVGNAPYAQGQKEQDDVWSRLDRSSNEYKPSTPKRKAPVDLLDGSPLPLIMLTPPTPELSLALPVGSGFGIFVTTPLPRPVVPWSPLGCTPAFADDSYTLVDSPTVRDALNSSERNHPLYVLEEEVFDVEAFDKEFFSEEVPNEEVFDVEAFDKEFFSEEVADEEVADEEVSNEEVSNEEVADDVENHSPVPDVPKRRSFRKGAMKLFKRAITAPGRKMADLKARHSS